MGRTLDPETLVANQAKTTLRNSPKAKTKYWDGYEEFSCKIIRFNTIPALSMY